MHVTRLEPDLALAHINRADLLVKLGRRDEAIEYLQCALLLSLDWKDARKGLQDAQKKIARASPASVPEEAAS